MVFGLYDLLKYFFKHYALISLGDNKTLLQKAGKKTKANSAHKEIWKC